MKAILLAAGMGVRLKPITEHVPKCLVPICGIPLLELWLEKLVKLGIEEILINTHYLAEQVERFVNQSDYKTNIRLVNEPKLLGTAGTLIAQKDFWQGHETIVIHADNFCCSDLHGLVKQHHKRPDDTDITALLFETDSPQSCGIVELDEQNVITNFHEKVSNPPGNLASGALFVFNENVFDKYFSTLPANTSMDLSKDVIAGLRSKIFGWKTDAPYIDIGTVPAYLKAQYVARQYLREMA